MVALFVVLTFAAFILVDVVVQKVSYERARQTSGAYEMAQQNANEMTGQMVPAFAGINSNDFRIPKGLFFASNHTWAKINDDGKVRIGLDDFIQKVVGKIDHIEFVNPGEDVKAGDKIIKIVQDGRSIYLKSPVNGRIAMVNRDLEADPSKVKVDPYKAWAIEVEPKYLAKDLRNMKIAESARNWFQKELKRFKEFVSTEVVSTNSLVGATAQDGGIPVEGLLERMENGTWKKFETEFLG